MNSVRSNEEKASDRLRCEPVLDLGREKIDDGVEYHPGQACGGDRPDRGETNGEKAGWAKRGCIEPTDDGNEDFRLNVVSCWCGIWDGTIKMSTRYTFAP